jgi:hypothetical protein
MKNWQKVADRQFKNMDSEERASFAELRKIVTRRHIR